MVALARRVLDVEDDDLIGCIIHSVIDEVWVLSRYYLADAFSRLAPANFGKQNEVSQGVIDSGTDALCSNRIIGTNVIGKLGEVLHRVRRKSQLHASKRRNAASTSVSVAN